MSPEHLYSLYDACCCVARTHLNLDTTSTQRPSCRYKQYQYFHAYTIHTPDTQRTQVRVSTRSSCVIVFFFCNICVQPSLNHTQDLQEDSERWWCSSVRISTANLERNGAKCVDDSVEYKCGLWFLFMKISFLIGAYFYYLVSLLVQISHWKSPLGQELIF